VLGRLVALEPAQEGLLEKILKVEMINAANVEKALALEAIASGSESAMVGEKID
jgi:hypothetical protein